MLVHFIEKSANLLSKLTVSTYLLSYALCLVNYYGQSLQSAYYGHLSSF